MTGDKSFVIAAPGVFGARYLLHTAEAFEGFAVRELPRQHPARRLGYTHRVVTPAFDGGLDEWGLFKNEGTAEVVRDALADWSG